MNAPTAGQRYKFIDMTIAVLRVELRPRYIRGETETRAGREPINVRLKDATVFVCECDGVEYVNSEAEMLEVVAFGKLIA